MDGIIWAALIVAAALVYLANAIAKRPPAQVIQQPLAADTGPAKAPLTPNVLPSGNHSELAYTLAFDYKDEQVRIFCVPGTDEMGKPIWSYHQWVGGYFHGIGIANQHMVLRKSDAEIAVAEREALRAQEQRSYAALAGGS